MAIKRQNVEHPVDALKPYDKNPRKHSDKQVAQIVASITEFGFTNPLLVDEKLGVIAGHGRLMAAQKLGLKTVPCVQLTGLSKKQKQALVIADNKLALNASWDDELLAAELHDLNGQGFDMPLLGFDADELDGFLGEVGGNNGDTDSVPPVSEKPVSQTGDVWKLGHHRLTCGDSTKSETFERLLLQDAVNLVFTDPPYGVDYADKGISKVKKKIENDDLKDDALAAFFLAVFTCIEAAIPKGCPFYVCAPQGGLQMMMMMMMMQKACLPMRHELIWMKSSLVLGRADYHYKHEPILYGWKEGAGHPWHGGRDKTSVWEVDKPRSSDLHPTMKPVELVEIAINNSSKKGDIVLDAFGGSGTTIIASEKTGRICRMIELDPLYCDVIVKRWQEFTGKQATRQRDGKSFNSVSGAKNGEKGQKEKAA